MARREAPLLHRRRRAKAKNLESNPRCILTTGTNQLRSGLDVVVEGAAARRHRQGAAPTAGGQLEIEARLAFRGRRRGVPRPRWPPGARLRRHTDEGPLVRQRHPTARPGTASRPDRATRWTYRHETDMRRIRPHIGNSQESAATAVPRSRNQLRQWRKSRAGVPVLVEQTLAASHGAAGAQRGVTQLERVPVRRSGRYLLRMAADEPGRAAERKGPVIVACVVGGVAGAALAGHRGARAASVSAVVGAAGLGRPRRWPARGNVPARPAAVAADRDQRRPGCPPRVGGWSADPRRTRRGGGGDRDRRRSARDPSTEGAARAAVRSRGGPGPRVAAARGACGGGRQHHDAGLPGGVGAGFP